MEHPLVTPWMLNDGEAVRRTADRLRALAGLLGGAEVTVGSTLGMAATAMSWQGQITDRADEASREARTMVTRLADACQAAGAALLELAGAMSWHGPRLTALLQEGEGGGMPRFGSPVDPGPIHGLPVEPGTSLAQGAGPLLTTSRSSQPGLTVEPRRDIMPIGDREQEILQHVEDLELQDQRCHDRLQLIRADLDALFPYGTQPNFLRSLVPSHIWRRLIEAGVIHRVTPIRDRRRPFLGGVVLPPLHRTLPIGPALRARGVIRVIEPPHRHILPIQEDGAVLRGGEVSRGPSLDATDGSRGGLTGAEVRRGPSIDLAPPATR